MEYNMCYCVNKCYFIDSIRTFTVGPIVAKIVCFSFLFKMEKISWQ